MDDEDRTKQFANEAAPYLQRIKAQSDDQYIAKVITPATQSIADSTNTVVQFTKVAYDPKDMWDPSIYSFVVPFTGLWKVEACYQVETTSGTYNYTLAVYVNGSVALGKYLYYGNNGGGGNPCVVNGVAEIYLEKDDAVELRFRQRVGSTRSYPASTYPYTNWFSIRNVSAFLLPS